MANQIIDQENQAGAIGIGFGDTGSGRDYMCQGFIAQTSSIDAVSFKLQSTGSIGMAVWIDAADASSNPTGTVAVGIGGFTEIANATLSTTFKLYALSETVTLTPGTRYVICLAPWNTSTHVWGSDYRDVLSSVSNPYSSGRRVHLDDAFANPSAPDSGNADILFRTHSTVDTTRLYLNNAAAEYDPATERGAWDDTASYTPLLMDDAKSGASTTIGVAETSATNNYDVLLAKFVSPAIVTGGAISGVVNLLLGVLESDAAMNARWHVHMYVTTGDTDTPRGTLLTDKIGGDSSTFEWPTTAAGKMIAANLSSVTASAGDRIVMELGYRAVNTATTSYTGTINYGGTGSDLTDGSTSVTTLVGFIDFTTTGLFTSSTSIKTILGLAEASVKTVNGLANASMKTFNGLA